jgi:hypothetical protein
MSTTQPLQTAAQKALARTDEPTSLPPPRPGWTHAQLVAQLRKTGLADHYIVGRAEAEGFDPGSLDFAITMACLGESAMTLALGLQVPISVVVNALSEIWDEVCRSGNPRALVQAARQATLQHLKDLGATPEELEMFGQFL